MKMNIETADTNDRAISFQLEDLASAVDYGVYCRCSFNAKSTINLRLDFSGLEKKITAKSGSVIDLRP